MSGTRRSGRESKKPLKFGESEFANNVNAREINEEAKKNEYLKAQMTSLFGPGISEQGISETKSTIILALLCYPNVSIPVIIPNSGSEKPNTLFYTSIYCMIKNPNKFKFKIPLNPKHCIYSSNLKKLIDDFLTEYPEKPTVPGSRGRGMQDQYPSNTQFVNINPYAINNTQNNEVFYMGDNPTSRRQNKTVYNSISFMNLTYKNYQSVVGKICNSKYDILLSYLWYISFNELCPLQIGFPLINDVWFSGITPNVNALTNPPGNIELQPINDTNGNIFKDISTGFVYVNLGYFLSVFLFPRTEILTRFLTSSNESLTKIISYFIDLQGNPLSDIISHKPKVAILDYPINGHVKNPVDIALLTQPIKFIKISFQTHQKTPITLVMHDILKLYITSSLNVGDIKTVNEYINAYISPNVNNPAICHNTMNVTLELSLRTTKLDFNASNYIIQVIQQGGHFQEYNGDVLEYNKVLLLDHGHDSDGRIKAPTIKDMTMHHIRNIITQKGIDHSLFVTASGNKASEYERNITDLLTQGFDYNNEKHETPVDYVAEQSTYILNNACTRSGIPALANLANVGQIIDGGAAVNLPYQEIHMFFFKMNSPTGDGRIMYQILIFDVIGVMAIARYINIYGKNEGGEFVPYSGFVYDYSMTIALHNKDFYNSFESNTSFYSLCTNIHGIPFTQDPRDTNYHDALIHFVMLTNGKSLCDAMQGLSLQYRHAVPFTVINFDETSVNPRDGKITDFIIKLNVNRQGGQVIVHPDATTISFYINAMLLASQILYCTGDLMDYLINYLNGYTQHNNQNTGQKIFSNTIIYKDFDGKKSVKFDDNGSIVLKTNRSRDMDGGASKNQQHGGEPGFMPNGIAYLADAATKKIIQNCINFDAFYLENVYDVVLDDNVEWDDDNLHDIYYTQFYSEMYVTVKDEINEIVNAINNQRSGHLRELTFNLENVYSVHDLEYCVKEGLPLTQKEFEVLNYILTPEVREKINESCLKKFPHVLEYGIRQSNGIQIGASAGGTTKNKSRKFNKHSKKKKNIHTRKITNKKKTKKHHLRLKPKRKQILQVKSGIRKTKKRNNKKR